MRGHGCLCALARSCACSCSVLCFDCQILPGRQWNRGWVSFLSSVTCPSAFSFGGEADLLHCLCGCRLLERAMRPHHRVISDDSVYSQPGCSIHCTRHSLAKSCAEWVTGHSISGSRWEHGRRSPLLGAGVDGCCAGLPCPGKPVSAAKSMSAPLLPWESADFSLA